MQSGSFAHVNLQWTTGVDKASATATPVIQRANGLGDAFATIATLGAGVTTYTDTNDGFNNLTKVFQVKLTSPLYNDSAFAGPISGTYLRQGNA